MQIHNLKPKTERIKPMQVGRGGKRGKTSGRGTKGQGARAGRKIRPEIRDFIKRLPKLRGRGVNSFKSFAIKPVSISLSTLNVFAKGEKVTPTTLVAKGVLEIYKGKNQTVKILANGDLTAEALIIENCFVSEAAKAKIEQKGGTIK